MKATVWQTFLINRRVGRRTHMAHISVGVRNNGTIELDIKAQDNGNWDSNNITLEEASFLVTELNDAIKRAGKYRPATPGVPRPEVADAS